MYMFDLNWRCNRCNNWLIVPPIHVHSSVSYQQAIYQKYSWRSRESPSGYGPLKVLSSGVLLIMPLCGVYLLQECCVGYYYRNDK